MTSPLTSQPRTEPQLKEVMNDPIIQLLMKRDGVKEETLMPLVSGIFSEQNARGRQWNPK